MSFGKAARFADKVPDVNCSPADYYLSMNLDKGVKIAPIPKPKKKPGRDAKPTPSRRFSKSLYDTSDEKDRLRSTSKVSKNNSRRKATIPSRKNDRSSTSLFSDTPPSCFCIKDGRIDGYYTTICYNQTYKMDKDAFMKELRGFINYGVFENADLEESHREIRDLELEPTFYLLHQQSDYVPSHTAQSTRECEGWSINSFESKETYETNDKSSLNPDSCDITLDEKMARYFDSICQDSPEEYSPHEDIEDMVDEFENECFIDGETKAPVNLLFNCLEQSKLEHILEQDFLGINSKYLNWQKMLGVQEHLLNEVSDEFKNLNINFKEN